MTRRPGGFPRINRPPLATKTAPPAVEAKQDSVVVQRPAAPPQPARPTGLPRPTAPRSDNRPPWPGPGYVWLDVENRWWLTALTRLLS